MTAPLSTDQSSCLPTEEEQRAGLTIRGSLTSNDVVQRLRALCGCKACCLEAADEIERLQRYAEECREKFNAEYKATQHLLAQIERLKLGGSDVCATCHAHCVVIEDHMQTIDRLQRERDEAKAALAAASSALDKIVDARGLDVNAAHFRQIAIDAIGRERPAEGKETGR